MGKLLLITLLAQWGNSKFNDTTIVDDKKLICGTDADYWHTYNTSSTQYEFWTSDSDGAGADAVICYVPDGGDDLTCNGNLTVSGSITPGSLALGDDDPIEFGDSTDYWWVYDSANTQYELNSTDVDGGGTDGVVAYVADGTDNVVFSDGLQTKYVKAYDIPGTASYFRVGSGVADDVILRLIGGKILSIRDGADASNATLDVRTISLGNSAATGYITFQVAYATSINHYSTFTQFGAWIHSLHGRQFIIGERTHRDLNHDHATQTNPTLYVQSATSPDTDNTQWISLTHDQTDGIIDVGSGDIVLNDDTTINGNFALGDNDQLEFGGSTNYWLDYDSAATQWQLTSTDVDGGGTDGVVMYVADGSTDVTLQNSQFCTHNTGLSNWKTCLDHTGTYADLKSLGGDIRLSSWGQDILLTNGGLTDIGLVQFGGVTNSYPALTRDGNFLVVRLANNSADAGIRAASVLGTYFQVKSVSGGSLIMQDDSNPGDNSGTAFIRFRARDDASNFHDFSTISLDVVSSTSGSEYADLVFEATKNGVDATEFFRIEASIGATKFSEDTLVIDDAEAYLGTSKDYWLIYDSGNTQFELNSTNIDGGGTDGVVMYVADGTDDVVFNGEISVGTFTYHKDFAAGSANLGPTAPSWIVQDTTVGLEFDVAAEKAGIVAEVASCWVGNTDLTLKIYVADEAGDVIADGEIIEFDCEYRSLTNGEATDNGTSVTISPTYTQSGAGTDSARHQLEATIDHDNANQPITAADNMSMVCNRDVGGTDTYSGFVIVSKFELLMDCNGIPDH